MVCAEAMTPHGYHCLLLKYPAVRRDMGITLAVGKKLDAISAARDKEFLSLRMHMRVAKVSPATVRAVYAALDKWGKEDLALLNPAQKARLWELSLQEGGPSELERPDIASALGLSKNQVAKLNHADGEQVLKMTTSLSASLKDRISQLRLRQKARRAYMKTFAQSVLTPGQWKAWIRMQGRPLPNFD
jgi:hypothetical protein